MQKHFEFLIVGMNPGSILIGQVLSRKGKAFAIYGSLEDAEWPAFEPICITEPSLADCFRDLCQVNLVENPSIKDVPLRVKGEWKVADTELIASLPPAIQLAVKARNSGFIVDVKGVLSSLANEFSYVDTNEFSYRNLDLEKKQLQCADAIISFDRLVWCRRLDDLKELSVDALKEIARADHETRIECWMPLNRSEEDIPPDFLLPFRFKDDHFHAYCSEVIADEKTFLKCVVSLTNEIQDQSEETTKILRSLLRELKKELGTHIQQDSFSKVLSHPFVPKGATAQVGSYEITKDVFCFIPELVRRGQNAPDSYLERALEQSTWLEKLI